MGIWTHLIRSFLAHPSPQPKRHLDPFNRFCRVHGLYRQTDRPRYFVCSNRPHLASAAMRPKTWQIWATNVDIWNSKLTADFGGISVIMWCVYNVIGRSWTSDDIKIMSRSTLSVDRWHPKIASLMVIPQWFDYFPNFPILNLPSRGRGDAAPLKSSCTSPPVPTGAKLQLKCRNRFLCILAITLLMAKDYSYAAMIKRRYLDE